MSAGRKGLLGLATAAAIVFATGGTAAAAPTCGMELTRDLKLRQNLNCSASNTNGFEIKRNGVEIDLNGHRLIGDDSYYAINNPTGYDRLVVKNGRLDGWLYGAYNSNSSQSRFRNLRINLGGTNGGYGLYLYYGLQNTAKNVTVDNANQGAYVYEQDRLLVDRLTVTGSDDSSTYALYGGYVSGKVKRVKANGAYYGVYVYGYTGGLRVEDSVANNSGYAGFYVANSTPLWQHRYTLVDNTANNAQDYGFYAQYDVFGGGNRATGAGTQNCYNVPCGG